MIARPLLSFASLLLCSALVVAQTTWVVDALNGPGTDFTELGPAIAASSSGDVILVRDDASNPIYTAPGGQPITHSLTIIGQNGQALIRSSFVIAVPAGEHVVLRNLRLGPFHDIPGVGNVSAISASLCEGGVHLQNIEAHGWAHLHCDLRFTDCRLVTASDCSFDFNGNQTGRWTDCELAVFDNCFVSNRYLGVGGVQVTRSRVVAIDTYFEGGPPLLTLPNGSVAMQLEDSVLELAGNSLINGHPNRGIEWIGTSEVVLGPTATTTPLSGPTSSRVITTMSAYLYAGASMTIGVHGDPFGIGILSYGAQTATPLPLWGETYWLDLPTVNVFDFVLLDANGAASWSTSLPATLPAGLSLWLQSAVFDATTGFHLTTPAVVTTP